jgi:hypothetical protein
MGINQIFFSQEILDGWIEQEKIIIDQEYLIIPSKEQRFQIKPAMLFLNVVEGKDLYGLVGKVKLEEEIEQLGAEIYLNSVLIGDTAYEVRRGFSGVLTIKLTKSLSVPRGTPVSASTIHSAISRVTGTLKLDSLPNSGNSGSRKKRS